jgi:hypothetical protein
MIATMYGLADAGQANATGTPDLPQSAMIGCHPRGHTPYPDVLAGHRAGTAGPG